MTASNTNTLSISRMYGIAPATIYAAWLDRETIGRWLFATPNGRMQPVDLDPCVGGAFRIAEERGTALAVHTGTFVDLDPPHRIVFDFTTDPAMAPTRVTVALAPLGAGTLLTLSHPVAPEWLSFRARAEAGWRMILDNLATSLARDPSSRSP